MARLLSMGLLTVLGLGFTSGASVAQDTTKDRDFLIKAASGHNAEIQLGRLAESRTSNQHIKDFAAKLVKDHQVGYDELAKLFKSRNLSVVAGLEPAHRDEAKRLGELNGSDFDKSYLESMVKHHEAAIQLYEGVGARSQDAEIRNYAAMQLPTLRMHHQGAQDLLKKLGK